MLKIGQLAKQTQINASTIRYYEKLGLLPPAKRTQAGYRIYDLDDIQAINLIKLAQSLGFNLQEISALACQQEQLDHQQILTQLDKKKVEIEQLINELENRKQQINQLEQKLQQSWQQGECYQANPEDFSQ